MGSWHLGVRCGENEAAAKERLKRECPLSVLSLGIHNRDYA